MKKQLLFSAIALSGVLLFSACGETNVTSTVSVSTTEKEPASSVSSEDKKVNKESEKKDKEKKEEKLSFLYSGYYGAVTYFNEDGSVKEQIDSLLGEKYICGATDDYVILAEYIYEDGVGAYQLSTLDVNTKKEIPFFITQDIWTLDVYDGKIQVICREWGTFEYKECSFDAKTLVTVESNQNLYDSIKGYDVVWMPGNYEVFNKRCLERFLDENGYVILKKDDEYYKFDGSLFDRIRLSCIPSSFRGYMEDGFVFAACSEFSYSDDKLYIYKFDNGWEYLVSDNLAYYAGVNDSEIFFSEYNDENYILGSTTLHAFNPKTNMFREVFTIEKHPGIEAYRAPLYDASIVGDDIYFTYNDGVKTGWYKASLNEKNVTGPESLGITLKEYDYFKFGTVSAVSDRHFCPKCGVATNSVYDEYFRIDSSLSEKADEINELLEKRAQDSVRALLDSVYEPEDVDMCEEHSYPYGKETNEMYVLEVRQIGESTLTVTKEGEWYGGGVHGMPLLSHDLIDLKNGTLLAFTDLYSGSEEDFKQIVAEATKEVYNNFDYDRNPFFAGDAESAALQAYESIDFETASIDYYNDFLVVEFEPYVLGPYAAGFINVPIDYATLGIIIE